MKDHKTPVWGICNSENNHDFLEFILQFLEYLFVIQGINFCLNLYYKIF